ncbi:hypothetical protein QS257_02490 [Terrilactibacillus sp. S3-3]|nr:hypothetical protein QS257_02490 [Terrilactibacillus sp. S3-3]
MTFGSDSFYKPGAFSKTAAGQTLASLTEAGEQAGLGGSPNVIVDGTKMIVKYSVLGMKTIPAGLARMKGLKMKKVGDYIYITGERKWMELYLDRYGKSGKHQLFNTSLTSGQAVRISKRKVNGQLQLRPQGDYLIQESKDVKNYLTKNKFKVFGSGV